MQYKKFCDYEGYHSSYDFTVYDIAFVFVDEDEEGFDDSYLSVIPAQSDEMIH
jgi:hypothetical protein